MRWTMGGRRDVFVGHYGSDARGLVRGRSARREHQPAPRNVPDPRRAPELDLGPGTQQPSFDGAGQRHPGEHGDDRGSAPTEPGGLSKTLTGLRVIEAENVQDLSNLLGLSIVDRG
jgi:hypothetical protein